MSDIRKDVCPFPKTVYLAAPHIQQNIYGHKQTVGLFLTDKPVGGNFYEYTRAYDVDGLIAEICNESIHDGDGEYYLKTYEITEIIRKHFGKE